MEENFDEPDLNSKVEQKYLDKTVKSSGRVRFRETRRKPCFYYANYGFCHFGKDCRFSHSRSASSYGNRVIFNSRYAHTRPAKSKPPFRNVKHKSETSRPAAVSAKNASAEGSTASIDTVTNRSEPNSSIAKELAETCSLLEDVALYSDDKSHEDRGETAKTTEKDPLNACSRTQQKSSEPRITFEALKYRQLHDIIGVSDSELQDLRAKEVNYLKQRFPKCHVTEENGKFIIEFEFSSDMDLFYEPKPNMLRVVLGEMYPKEVCEIEFLEDGQLPPVVFSFSNKSIKGFLQERYKFHLSSGKVELVLRAFLRWLDRNLNELYTGGMRRAERERLAKEAGVEFVPYGESDESPTHNSPGKEVQCLAVNDAAQENSNKVLPEEEKEEEEVVITYEKEFCYTSESESDGDAPQSKQDVRCSSFIRSGTEVKLLYLELRESAAAVECQKIAITAQCGRCKTLHEIITYEKQNRPVPCSKCRQILSTVFYPVVVHPHSSILGYLHLSGCQAVDLALVQCLLKVSCLNCSKRCSVDGVNFGKAHITWCTYCNHKFSIAVQGAKFHQLSPAENTGKTSQISAPYESSKKKSRDPVFKDGKPLPNNGACKHYKKSHRWLRFPCCGKAYPCDLCHEENEGDHEMKFASRMICGFCSKEQPYGKDKPCDSCSGLLTKKAGAHWEGGKGCRDRLKMCRDDRQKYSGVNKTISRKSAPLPSKKKKS